MSSTFREDKWFCRYMNMAELVATWSKDPSTRVGAVVVGLDRRHVAIGYNGFPPGISDDERLGVRELKYKLIQHAERNVLDNAQFNLSGGTLVTTLYPCHECAKSIISRGIRTVVTKPAPDREPWASSARVAAEIFREAGIVVHIMTR